MFNFTCNITRTVKYQNNQSARFFNQRNRKHTSQIPAKNKAKRGKNYGCHCGNRIRRYNTITFKEHVCSLYNDGSVSHWLVVKWTSLCCWRTGHSNIDKWGFSSTYRDTYFLPQVRSLFFKPYNSLDSPAHPFKLVLPTPGFYREHLSFGDKLCGHIVLHMSLISSRIGRGIINK